MLVTSLFELAGSLNLGEKYLEIPKQAFDGPFITQRQENQTFS